MKAIDLLLLLAVVLVLLHAAGVDLLEVLQDIVVAVQSLPSPWQFGDSMWIADVMDAAAKVGAKGGIR